ncbi:Septin-domain-containing protein [Lipomyces japonicus]|uniref:Septin-domain-containing protein n=1 Tax=Lipomyces japonicus TaxID=56871 RepID=UPI0034CE24E6
MSFNETTSSEQPAVVPSESTQSLDSSVSSASPTTPPHSVSINSLSLTAPTSDSTEPLKTSGLSSKEVSVTVETAGLYPNGNGSNIIRKKLTGYVGFSNVPLQYHRKSIRNGFNLNIMVVGESGLGKSTLVSTLFNMPLYPPRPDQRPSADIPKTVAIQSISADLEESDVRLKLTVVDTPGFGDFVNNEDAWKPIVGNIDQRFDAFLEAESKVNRASITDNRIHAVLYFIAPTGHSLKPLDIEVLKKLHNKVNIIPIIAKSDILTDEEIVSFKARIRADLDHHKINIFETPRYEIDSEDTQDEQLAILSKIPFAVVGATTEISTPDGRTARGRKYPWGVVEVDNEDHCDFVKLRSMLVKNYTEELKEYTNEVLYENYRTSKLLALGILQNQSVFKEVNPSAKIDEQRALDQARLAKMEVDMNLVFRQKVSDKEQKLKQSEEELFARHREMKETLERQRKELEERIAKLERDRHNVVSIEEKTKKKGFSLRS